MEAPPDGEAEAGGGPLLSDEERLVDICGCTSDEARAALLAAGPGGLALAVDFVLGAGSALKERERDEAEQPPKLVCLVRADLGMGTGKVSGSYMRTYARTRTPSTPPPPPSRWPRR